MWTATERVVTKAIAWDEYFRGEPANLEHCEFEGGVVIELAASCFGHRRVVINLVRSLSFWRT
ncbi:MAG: hypothetical protein RMK89_00310 [Armatimonadota bacterium]|nr:hypothetical protein [Armatimonadota bacterium]MDW8141880.1 hypothetical protein [Armatimonadota bacterium]